MIGVLIAAVFTQSESWYGPAEIQFRIPFEGSPYDAANDVRVRFVSGTDTEERLAFWKDGEYHAVLLARHPGTYTPVIVRDGAEIVRLKTPVKVDQPSSETFVRIGTDKVSFVQSDGKPWWPIGHNLAWGGGGMPPLTQMLQTMGQNRMNWARIWSCAWDGKNPMWPPEGKLQALDVLYEPSLVQWDQICGAADKEGIKFQWVLFHHGPWSAEVDPNWNENPWNVKNGGFLKDPSDFFSDNRAKQLSKSYLRYVIARYAHHPGVMAWELFNEVENTQAMRHGHEADVWAWHKEMADYVRSLDSYHHLVTTSAGTGPELTGSMDYLQPHGYPANVESLVLAAAVPKDKPIFFGEVGLGGSNPSPTEQRRTVRDAIYGGLLAGHAGAAEFWYWDAVQNLGLAPEYKQARDWMDAEGIQPGPGVQPIQAEVETQESADLLLLPGLSWAPSTKLTFDLPKEANGASLGRMSSYLQGTGHPDMGSEFTFRFNSPAAGQATLLLGTLSANGAEIVATLDGSTLIHKVFTGSGKEKPLSESLVIPFRGGSHVLIVKNVGPDWVNMKGYRFSGFGPAASASVGLEGGKVIGRLLSAADGPIHAKFGGLPLPDGEAVLRLTDLDTRKTVEVPVSIKSGRIDSAVTVTAKDAVLTLQTAK